MTLHAPIPDPRAPQPVRAHIRALMGRRRWSERDLAMRIGDEAGTGEACALVTILLSPLDCPLGHYEARVLGRVSGEGAAVWLARDAAWRDAAWREAQAEGRGDAI